MNLLSIVSEKDKEWKRKRAEEERERRIEFWKKHGEEIMMERSYEWQRERNKSCRCGMRSYEPIPWGKSSMTVHEICADICGDNKVDPNEKTRNKTRDDDEGR